MLHDEPVRARDPVDLGSAPVTRPVDVAALVASAFASLPQRASCSPGLAVFNAPQAAANASCLFAHRTFPARADAPPDRLAARVPWFSPTGHLFVACAAWAHFFSTLAVSAVTDQLDGWDKQCHAGRLSLAEYLNRVSQTAGTVPVVELETRLKAWFASDAAGQAWLQAVTRAHVLATPFGAVHDFTLLGEAWAAMLPSQAAGRALGDVNTHEVRLPPLSVGALFARNALVDARGRVVAVDAARRRFEVFYPQEAPWSFKPLMLDPVGPYRKHMEFRVNHEQRARLRAELEGDAGAADCLAKAGELLAARQFTRAEPCANGGVAVARVFVISQHLSREMFHFLCESLPRAGAFLDWLVGDDTVLVHATDCARKAGYCASFLQALGIAPGRLVGGLVFAGELAVPAGGRGHWPLSSLWGIESLVARARLPSTTALAACAAGNVLVIKRKSTRLQPWPSDAYERWARDIDFALRPLFAGLTVRFFDDQDRQAMASMPAQIEALRWADVVVGAHGAAMAWIPFLKPCAHVVSLRGRSNSDIYEHLALGFGVGFHHAHFRYHYDDYIDEVITGVGDALGIQAKPERVSVVVFAETPDMALPFSVLRASPRCIARDDDDDDDNAVVEAHSHYAVVRPGVGFMSPALLQAVAAELGRVQAVAFFLPGDATSALLVVDVASGVKVDACALSEDELALRFASVLVIKSLRQGMTCAGVERPFRALAIVDTSKAHARLWTRNAWQPAMPVPRDLCAREAPAIGTMGEPEAIWRVRRWIE